MIDPVAGRAFAAQFRAFLSWVHDEDSAGEQVNDVVALVRGHLNADNAVASVVERRDIDTVVERTDSVTASFLKELVRRAVLVALTDLPTRPDAKPRPDAGPLTEVTEAQVGRALDELLDSDQGVTRTLLGVGVDPQDLPAGALSAGPRPGLAPHSRRTKRGGGGQWVTLS